MSAPFPAGGVSCQVVDNVSPFVVDIRHFWPGRKSHLVFYRRATLDSDESLALYFTVYLNSDKRKSVIFAKSDETNEHEKLKNRMLNPVRDKSGGMCREKGPVATACRKVAESEASFELSWRECVLFALN